MKTATVRELRNHYSGLMKWIEAGEEIRITRRGKPIARLVPDSTDAESQQIDWTRSPALQRDRAGVKRISSATAHELIQESSGKW